MPKLKRRKDGRFMKWAVLQDGTRKPVYARSEPELNRKIKEIEKSDEKGIDVSDKTTVRSWSETWVNQYNSKLRPTTQATYCNMLNAHILPQIGAMQLKAVRPVHIQAVMNSVAEQSESLQKNVYRAMHRLFSTAIINRLIAVNPCAGVTITPRTDLPDPQEKLRALSKKQREELLEAVKGTRAEVFVNLGLWCGLRREESLGLKWEDIKFKDETLTVKRTVTFADNEAIESDKTKSKQSRRTIPIPSPLLKLLLNKNPQKANSVIIVKKHKRAPDETFITPYVCPNTFGKIMTKSSYDKIWKNVTKSVDFEVTSHMLRHTYCTWLYDNGVDLKTAQYLMGHADIRMTANIYTQIGTDQVQNAKKKIKEIFRCSQRCSQKRKSSKKRA